MRGPPRRILPLALAIVAALAQQAAAAPPYFSLPVASWQPSTLPVAARSAAVSPDGTVLYVTDSLNRVLTYSTATGQYLGGWGSYGSGKGQLNDPTGVAADPYGDVWVADTGNGRVQKFTPAGKRLLGFKTAQPVGIAAAGSEMYVLSGLFRAVDARSFKGSDYGAFVATFPNGFDPYGHYDPPANSADGIAADPKGNAVVTGTVTQRLVDGNRPSCKSPLSTLPDLPDPLVAPAVTTFSDNGSALNQLFTWSAGAICWSNNLSAWSYGLSGVRSGGSVAVDPATGRAYATVVMGSGPYFVQSDQEETIGIWDPRDGPTVNPTGLSSSLYGPLRAIAIGCDSSLYLITDQRILRYRSSTPAGGLCVTRSHLLDFDVIATPAVGGVPPPGRSPGPLDVTTVCHTLKGCKGTLNVELVPCPHCRPLAVLTQPVKLRTKSANVLSLALPHRLVRRVASGGRLLARIKLRRRAPASLLALRAPSSISAHCGAPSGLATASASALTVSGTVSPARAGTRVRLSLIGPGGESLERAATTNAHGRYSLRLPPGANGVWTAAARLSGSARREPAQAQCGAVVGPRPSLLSAPLSGVGRALSELDLQLSCPASATVGDRVAISGNLIPGDAGVPVALTFAGPAGESGSATVTSGPQGSFSGDFIGASGGTWTVTAAAPLAGTTLRRTCTVPVAKLASTVTLDCPASVPFPGPDSFTGSLSPVIAGSTVTVTFTKPGQNDLVASGTVDAAGGYTVSFSPPVTGQWNAQASWPGDATHAGASSSSCSFQVG